MPLEMSDYQIVLTAIQAAENQLTDIFKRYTTLSLPENRSTLLENDDMVAFIEVSDKAVEEMCIECNKKLSSLASRLKTRTHMVDPVTKAPLYGPKMREKVNSLIERFDSWKIHLETSDVLRDIRSMALMLREEKMCKLEEEEKENRLRKEEEARRKHETLQLKQEDEEEHMRQMIERREIERQILARKAQAIRELKAKKLEESTCRREEELQKLKAEKEAVVLGKEGLRQALQTLERNVNDNVRHSLIANTNTKETL